MKLNNKQILLIILALALIIKLIYFLFFLPQAGNSAALSIDEMYHYRWAGLLTQGELIANAPYFRAPLYPFFLAFLMKISFGSIAFIRLFQLLLGLGTIILIWKTALKISDYRVAALACLLYIFYPVTTYFESRLLLDSPFLFLIMASFYLFISLNNRRYRLILCGIFLGLAVITRPTAMVFLPIIVLLLLFHKRETLSGLVRVKQAALFGVIVILVIAPVTMVNYFTSDQFIPVSYQGGINFYIGNNPNADGLSASLPPFGNNWQLADADYLAYDVTGTKLRYGEQSSFWYGEAFDFIQNNPGQFLRLLLKKAYYFFAGHELSNNNELSQDIFGNAFLSVFPVRFFLLTGLTVLSLFWWSQYKKRQKYIYFIILIFAIVTILFFVTTRFRLPVIPFLALTAAQGIVILYENIRERRVSLHLILAIVTAVLISVLAVSDLYGAVKPNYRHAMFLRGNRAFRAGSYEQAARIFDNLSVIKPYYQNSYLNLGNSLLKLGDNNLAMAAYKKELWLNPLSAEAANNLSAIYYLNGVYDSALTLSGMALTIKPYYPEAAVHFLRAAQYCRDTSILADIETARLKIRSYLSDNPAYLFEEALYLAAFGKLEQAIANHLKVLEITGNKDSRQVAFDDDFSTSSLHSLNSLRHLSNYQLGYLSGLTGDFEKAAKYSAAAIALNPDFREAYINLISAYRSLGDNQRADSVAGEFLRRWPDGI